jgi:dTDP-4-amino-4,6-dideoxygalactose transaminase
MKVPFVDLPKQTQAMKQDIMKAVEGIVDSCQFVLGPEVSAFESEFAEFVGAKFGNGCRQWNRCLTRRLQSHRLAAW